MKNTNKYLIWAIVGIICLLVTFILLQNDFSRSSESWIYRGVIFIGVLLSIALWGILRFRKKKTKHEAD